MTYDDLAGAFRPAGHGEPSAEHLCLHPGEVLRKEPRKGVTAAQKILTSFILSKIQSSKSGKMDGRRRRKEINIACTDTHTDTHVTNKQTQARIIIHGYYVPKSNPCTKLPNYRTTAKMIIISVNTRPLTTPSSQSAALPLVATLVRMSCCLFTCQLPHSDTI